MFETPLNQKTVTCKLKRIEVCDLLIACTTISIAAKKDGETGALHKLLIEKAKEFKGVGGVMLASAAWFIANAPTIIEEEDV